MVKFHFKYNFPVRGKSPLRPPPLKYKKRLVGRVWLVIVREKEKGKNQVFRDLKG